ncbi:hypothetical protein BKA58DRAFT_379633 [Alternaria rosae]|uniref:uncharacterized protein n=1 Tax=Alternaria rosae TaxID=1187941 RepID=UPI001E8E3C61|nr:uncharacterized protein BKA58DRAFT_379633 [Alternaria rosae]KAH6875338.1 hypothetical protein BKA58DRAFT_379633 [Alternaria rosae]
MVGCPARLVHLHLWALRVQTLLARNPHAQYGQTSTTHYVKSRDVCPRLIWQVRYLPVVCCTEHLSDSHALLDDRSCV